MKSQFEITFILMMHLLLKLDEVNRANSSSNDMKEADLLVGNFLWQILIEHF